MVWWAALEVARVWMSSGVIAATAQHVARQTWRACAGNLKVWRASHEKMAWDRTRGLGGRQANHGLHDSAGRAGPLTLVSFPIGEPFFAGSRAR